MSKVRRNNNITDELKRLKMIERQINKLEKERSRLEVLLVKEAGGAGSVITKKHARRGMATYAYNRFRRRRFIYYLVTSIGAVLVWAGIWGVLDSYKVNHWLALGAGIAVIWITRNYKA